MNLYNTDRPTNQQLHSASYNLQNVVSEGISFSYLGDVRMSSLWNRSFWPAITVQPFLVDYITVISVSSHAFTSSQTTLE
jgi:hypothetical protein